MSIVSADRAVELISSSAWGGTEVLRAFWLKVEGPRERMARDITRSVGEEEIVALVVRDNVLTNPNRILSDMQQLLDGAKPQLAHLVDRRPDRLTIVVLMKQEFASSQVGSPITLPDWFPVRPGLETHFFLTDLVGAKDGALLSCREAQIERIAELVYGLEDALVSALDDLNAANGQLASSFLLKLTNVGGTDSSARIARYRSHVNQIASPRGYRPNASSGSRSLVSDILRLHLGLNSDDLAMRANELATYFSLGDRIVKPSYLGVSLRPRRTMSTGGKNWYSLIVGIYQAYQVMNASAHAGDYGLYAVALIHYSSLDLQAFLLDATSLLE